MAKLVIEHVSKSSQWWRHHTLHQELSLQNSLAGTKNNTQFWQALLLLVFSPLVSWAGTIVQSDERYGAGSLHPGQVLTGNLPLLSHV